MNATELLEEKKAAATALGIVMYIWFCVGVMANSCNEKMILKVWVWTFTGLCFAATVTAMKFLFFQV
jgi:hypothetical protein